VQAVLRAELAKKPREPLFAYGADPIYWGGSRLTAQELNQVSPTVPIMVQLGSGHIAVANDTMLKLVRAQDTTAWKALVASGQVVQENGRFTGELDELAAGMIAAGIMSTTFVSLGTDIASDRDDGTLKRLRGTPVPAAAYFLGKVVLVAVTTVAQIAIMLTVAVLLFDLSLPATAADWSTFGWVFTLGVVACSLLGIAISSLARDARAATAVTQLPYLTLQFISGVFVNPLTALPAGLVVAASFFPVKWMAQGFRSVFLPDSMVVLEPAGSWELDRVALVLGAWCAVGLVLCLTTFRWRRGPGG